MRLGPSFLPARLTVSMKRSILQKLSGSSESRVSTTTRSRIGHLVAYVYQPDDLTPTLYAGDVIKDIVSRFFVFGGVTEGIDTSNVEDGPEIEKFVFNYVPASQAFDDIADLTGYVWYIDYEEKTLFYPTG